MFNILKYEWLKRWKLFLAGLVFFTVADIDLVARLLQKSSPTFLSGIFVSLVFTMAIVLFFSQVFRMYSVLFSEEGLLTLSATFLIMFAFYFCDQSIGSMDQRMDRQPFSLIAAVVFLSRSP